MLARLLQLMKLPLVHTPTQSARPTVTASPLQALRLTQLHLPLPSLLNTLLLLAVVVAVVEDTANATVAVQEAVEVLLPQLLQLLRQLITL